MKGSSAFTNAPYRAQDFGSGGSGGVSAALSTASITTSWARYTHTFTLPSISGKTVGAGSYLQINLVRANVNNVTIDLANCQLEFGSTATDFEHRSYGEELALCQRYYQTYSNIIAQFEKHQNDAFDAHVQGFFFSHPIMRSLPSLTRTNENTWYGAASSWTSTSGKWNVRNNNPSHVGLEGQYDGGTGNTINQVQCNLALDAEL
jgi:hypothetical protein